MEFKKHTLENGLTIVAEINPEALSAAVGFFKRTGSRDEKPEISGVSHILEHMMFKGTDKLTALEVNQAFDKLGANFNASTSEENTIYYAAVLPEYLSEVTDLWSQLMRPSLRDEDFDIEKNVIKQEIAMYKDLPQFDVMDQCMSLHFKDHPCGNSVLGTNESIDALTSQQMRDYFARRYAPNNMVLACCGNLDFDKICDLIATKCSSWTPSDATRDLADYPGSMEKVRVTNETLVREHTYMMSPSVSMQDSRRYAASLLSMVIGDSTGSRYFWELIDPAIAESAGMFCNSLDGTGAFCSYIKCDPKNVDDVTEIINGIFAGLKDDGISDEELQAAKNKVLSALTIRSEVPMGRLSGLGLNWVYRQEYRSLAQDVADINAVTVEQVTELLTEFDLTNYTAYSAGPA
jgi:predicted Zn-dependent peptidase